MVGNLRNLHAGGEATLCSCCKLAISSVTCTSYRKRAYIGRLFEEVCSPHAAMSSECVIKALIFRLQNPPPTQQWGTCFSPLSQSFSVLMVYWMSREHVGAGSAILLPTRRPMPKIACLSSMGSIMYCLV